MTWPLSFPNARIETQSVLSSKSRSLKLNLKNYLKKTLRKYQKMSFSFLGTTFQLEWKSRMNFLLVQYWIRMSSQVNMCKMNWKSVTWPLLIWLTLCLLYTKSAWKMTTYKQTMEITRQSHHPRVQTGTEARNCRNKQKKLKYLAKNIFMSKNLAVLSYLDRLFEPTNAISFWESQKGSLQTLARMLLPRPKLFPNRRRLIFNLLIELKLTKQLQSVYWALTD